MQRLFSSFPTGVSGVALLLLRMCTAVTLICELVLRHGAPLSSMVYGAAGLIALAVLAGAMLPFSCAAAIILQLYASGWPLTAPLVISVVHTVALAGLGAGAYSVDAILYGRRVVILPKAN